MINSEIWLPIKNYQGYEVSNLGRVKSFLKKKTGSILKSPLNVDGYPVLGLYIKGKRFNFRVHRLVAITFIDNPNGYSQVNHINGIKTDNNVENLEWCDCSYNIRHAYSIGLKPIKDDHPNAKLVFKDVKHIRALFDKGASINKLSFDYGVSRSTIENVVKNIIWVDPDYKYKHGNIKFGVGELHPQSKLTESDVRIIRNRYSLGDTSYRKLADEYGVDKALIGRIVRRQLWKHVD